MSDEDPFVQVMMLTLGIQLGNAVGGWDQAVV